jgi:hypothetical protein
MWRDLGCRYEAETFETSLAAVEVATVLIFAAVVAEAETFETSSENDSQIRAANRRLRNLTHSVE